MDRSSPSSLLRQATPESWMTISRLPKEQEASSSENNAGSKRMRYHTDTENITLSFEPVQRSFACPFRKHDPRRYDINSVNRSCALSSFTSISRLKEHLYRRHKQPPFCKRCGCVCENKDELDAHYISDITCERNEELQAPEGLPTGLLEKLKSRKKIIKHQTEEARWRYIYCLIFPEETKIPSPYFEPYTYSDAGDAIASKELLQFNEFSRKLLPDMFSEKLTGLSIEESLQAKLVNAIQECQSHIYKLYTASLSRNDTSMATDSLSRTLPATALQSTTTPKSQGLWTFSDPSGIYPYYSRSDSSQQQLSLLDEKYFQDLYVPGTTINHGIRHHIPSMTILPAINYQIESGVSSRHRTTTLSRTLSLTEAPEEENSLCISTDCGDNLSQHFIPCDWESMINDGALSQEPATS